jgi:CelD/BcsL family acetyltransferase involved in cellulose biosynthesis
VSTFLGTVKAQKLAEFGSTSTALPLTTYLRGRMIKQLHERSQQDPEVHLEVLPKENKVGSTRVYEVDPLGDRRWQSFIERHPQASIFHSVGWLQALRRTYGYEPVIFTTSPPASDLENGLAFCRVRSWITGNRLVSLPFSDYSAPLCDREEEFENLIGELRPARGRQEWKYIEVRPMQESFRATVKKLGFGEIGKYVLHRLDLEPEVEEIFRRFDKNSVQRRVRRAEREGIVEVCGNSEVLLREFYRLLIRTRARHSLPPQPYAWFRNLFHCLGEAVDLRLAYLRDVPIAAVLTLHFKDTSYYKYGSSDERFHKLGAIPFLLWRAILRAKAIGSRTFDLGRTESDQQGLITFKSHWTPVSEVLTYWTFPSASSLPSNQDWKFRMIKRVCAHLPERLLEAVGTMIYRHIG